MTLDVDAQRFLATGYGLTTAQALDDHDSLGSLRHSSYGGCGSGYWWTTDATGIHYNLIATDGYPASTYNKGGWCTGTTWAHTITWAQIRAHRDAQPRQTWQQLHDEHQAGIAEERRHWDASHAISPTGYSNPTDEQRALLDAEAAHTMAEHRRHIPALWAAIRAMLPLYDTDPDEPADLIEWAEALA